MQKVRFKIKDYQEALLKALLLFTITIYVFVNFDSFIADMGHMATSTKGKLLQAILATMNKFGGKYLVLFIVSIPTINYLLKARFYYRKRNILNTKETKRKSNKAIDQMYILSNKEYEKIISKLESDDEALMKLCAILVFLIEGNGIIVKNKNGQNNIGVYYRINMKYEFEKLKVQYHIKKIMEVSDWVQSITNTSIYTEIVKKMDEIATFNGYKNRLDEISSKNNL